MSGYRLRALLEDKAFVSNLTHQGTGPVFNYNQNSCYNSNNSNANLSPPQQLNDGKVPHHQNHKSCLEEYSSLKPSSYVREPAISVSDYTQDAGGKDMSQYQLGEDGSLGKKTENVTPQYNSLIHDSIWSSVKGVGEDDLNLEYMDLDEFLNETGLDINFGAVTNIAPSISLSPALSPQSRSLPLSPPVDHPISPQGSVDYPVQIATTSGTPSPAQPLVGVVSPLPTTVSPQTSVVETAPLNSPGRDSLTDASADSAPSKREVVLTADQVVKKRKYSEDGEGLTETSVVVVPGQEGFDPASVKFAPEELQPQPIIKKSKKQFVLEENKDDKYWKRRNKNNVAAKRSREARRAKENQIIMRAGFLEREIGRLTEENNVQKDEIDRLKSIIEQLQKNQSTS